MTFLKISLNDKLRFSAAVCCVLTLTQSGRVFAADPEFQLEDLKRIVSLSDARISPDGKQIAKSTMTRSRSPIIIS